MDVDQCDTLDIPMGPQAIQREGGGKTKANTPVKTKDNRNPKCKPSGKKKKEKPTSANSSAPLDRPNSPMAYTTSLSESLYSVVKTLQDMAMIMTQIVIEDIEV